MMKLVALLAFVSVNAHLASGAAGPDDAPSERGLATTTTQKWHPVYTAGWSAGYCRYTRDDNTLGYATQLACCTGAYRGQSSGYCLSQLPSPPTSAPTGSGGLDVYYPDYDLPYAEGYCINDRPLPAYGGRPLYESMLACCKGAYAGQASGVCLSKLPSPPTSAPTEAGGLDLWYADYSINDYSQGVCINARPLPNGRVTYNSQLACCKGAYGSQSSGKCLSDLPSPPTSSPTMSGGLAVWYPDYSRGYANGVCVNDYPLPSGIVNYPTQMACCNGVYSSQFSQACIKDVAGVVTAEVDVEETTTDSDGDTITTTRTTVYMSTLGLFGLDMPETEAEKTALISTLESTILALIQANLPSNEVVTDVDILSIGGVARRALRQMLGRLLQDDEIEVAFTVVVEEGGAPERSPDVILDLISQIVEAVTAPDSEGMSAFVELLKEKARESGNSGLGQLMKGLRAALKGPQEPEAWAEVECDDEGEGEGGSSIARRTLVATKSSAGVRGGDGGSSASTSNPNNRLRLIHSLMVDTAEKANTKKGQVAPMKGGESRGQVRRRRLSNKYHSSSQGRKKGWCKANEVATKKGYYTTGKGSDRFQQSMSFSLCLSMSTSIDDSQSSESSDSSGDTSISMSISSSESSGSSDGTKGAGYYAKGKGSDRFQ